MADLDRFRREAEAIVDEQARSVIDAPWPDPPRRRARRVRGRDRRACTSRCWIRQSRSARRRHSAAANLNPDCRATSIPARRSIPRDRRFSTRSCSAFAMLLRPIPVCSCTARTSAAVRQRVSAASAAARAVRRSHHQLAARRRRRRSASASARRWPASGRSARCSSTTSSRPASISS